MKLLNKILPILFAGVMQVAVLLTLTSDVDSQTVWKHLEAGNREISFSLPEGFLFNKERSSAYDGMDLFAFENGVTLRASISNQQDPVANLSRVSIETTRAPAVLDFEISGIRGRSVTMIDRGYEHKLYFASKKSYYVLEVISESKDNSAVAAFLRSIRIKGQPLLESSDGEPSSSDGEATSIKSLKPSPEVAEAHKRKTGKFEGKVEFEPLSAYSPCSQDPNVRPAFVVTSLMPDMASLPAHRGPVNMSGDMLINVRLLSDGRVGDIIVYSDIERRVLRVFADAAKKLKFVPAERNGRPADHCEFIKMGFGVSTSIRMFSTQE